MNKNNVIFISDYKKEKNKIVRKKIYELLSITYRDLGKEEFLKMINQIYKFYEDYEWP